MTLLMASFHDDPFLALLRIFSCSCHYLNLSQIWCFSEASACYKSSEELSNRVPVLGLGVWKDIFMACSGHKVPEFLEGFGHFDVTLQCCGLVTWLVAVVMAFSQLAGFDFVLLQGRFWIGPPCHCLCQDWVARTLRPAYTLGSLVWMF